MLNCSSIWFSSKSCFIFSVSCCCFFTRKASKSAVRSSEWVCSGPNSALQTMQFLFLPTILGTCCFLCHFPVIFNTTYGEFPGKLLKPPRNKKRIVGNYWKWQNPQEVQMHYRIIGFSIWVPLAWWVHPDSFREAHGRFLPAFRVRK